MDNSDTERQYTTTRKLVQFYAPIPLIPLEIHVLILVLLALTIIIYTIVPPLKRTPNRSKTNNSSKKESNDGSER